MIDLLVEGVTDEIFVRRVFADMGLSVGTVYGRRGVSYLVEKSEGVAVRGLYGGKVLILADAMDMGDRCPPLAARSLVANQHPGTLVRLAERELESWILASRREFAQHFGVSIALVPSDPDLVADPKQTVVNLARRSRFTRIREMVVPAAGVSATVGAGYVDAIQVFMDGFWSLPSALNSSPSFSRFVQRLSERFI